MRIIKKIGNYMLFLAIISLIAWRLLANKRHYENELSMSQAGELEIPVLIAPVEYKLLKDSFTLTGTFKPFNHVVVVSETQGQVLQINNITGSEVSKGQILATVDNEIIREQYKIAKQSFEKARKDYERYQNLAKNEAISKSQIEEIELSYRNAESNYITSLKKLNDTGIRSPINGYISARHINTGSYITPGTPLFEITNIHKLKFNTKLTVEQIQKVQKGEKVDIGCDAFTGIEFRGSIYSKNVRSDATGRYEVEIVLDNFGTPKILAGMTGSATFTAGEEGQLVIPRKAVYGSLRSPEVYVVQNNLAIHKPVVVKPNSAGMLTVLDGLNENDNVVVKGHINLKDSTRVKILTEKN